MVGYLVFLLVRQHALCCLDSVREGRGAPGAMAGCMGSDGEVDVCDNGCLSSLKRHHINGCNLGNGMQQRPMRVRASTKQWHTAPWHCRQTPCRHDAPE